MEDVKRMLMRVPKKPTIETFDAPMKPKAFPNAFDSRTRWPGCVHPVLDQGQCGSCWAFGATESLRWIHNVGFYHYKYFIFSDRFCIESNGTVNVVLSPQSLVSCDWEGNFGCDGGVPQLAWEYM
jgi:cathepsin B